MISLKLKKKLTMILVALSYLINLRNFHKKKNEFFNNYISFLKEFNKWMF